MSLKIALFEHKYHEELLLPQINLLLQAGHKVHLITSSAIASSDSLTQIRDYISTHAYKNTSRIFSKLKMLIDIPLYLKKNEIDVLIINTLDSTFCGQLLNRTKNITSIGFIHNADNFAPGKKFHPNVKKVSSILVLSDYVSRYMKSHNIDTTPIYLTAFNQDTISRQPTKNEAVRIVIPGQLDYKRRDYQSLLDACPHNTNIKIILLGNAKKNDGPCITQKIKEKKLERQFLWFDHYVPHNEFIRIISTADYIMPLIHNNCIIYKCYIKCKTTAAFMWAIAIKKPLLMEKDFAVIEEFSGSSLYYDLSSLKKLFIQLSTNETKKTTNYLPLQDNYLTAISAAQAKNNR